MSVPSHVCAVTEALVRVLNRVCILPLPCSSSDRSCTAMFAAAHGLSGAPLGHGSVRSRESSASEGTGTPVLPTLTCCGHSCSQVPGSGQCCGLPSLFGEQLLMQSHWEQPSLHTPGLAQVLCRDEMRGSLSGDSLPMHSADSDESGKYRHLLSPAILEGAKKSS